MQYNVGERGGHVVTVLGHLQYNTIRYNTIQYDMGERGGDVVTVLGHLQYNMIQYNTIRRGGTWTRRGNDPWAPTIQYNTTWGNVEDTW